MATVIHFSPPEGEGFQPSPKGTLKYFFIDGTCFKMHFVGPVSPAPILVAVGVADTGRKIVLGMQTGDKVSASTWCQYFKDLKRKGINSSTIELGNMDGLPDLEKVFQKAFAKVEIQRCQVHVAAKCILQSSQEIETGSCR